MEEKTIPEYQRELQRGEEAFAAGDTLTALYQLEKGLAGVPRRDLHSLLGFCIAKERGQFRKGIDLCNDSLAADAQNPLHYLNLGRILVLSGDRSEAIQVFRQGMAAGGSPELVRKLEEMGMRRAPVIGFLGRDNPVNKYLGKFLGRIGLR